MIIVGGAVTDNIIIPSFAPAGHHRQGLQLISCLFVIPSFWNRSPCPICLSSA